MKATLSDAVADGRLVHVRGGRVDQAVAGVDGVDHAAFAFGRIGDLEHAKAQHGHDDSIVQGDMLHGVLLRLVAMAHSLAARAAFD
jgi:hypothetical protein